MITRMYSFPLTSFNRTSVTSLFIAVVLSCSLPFDVLAGTEIQDSIVISDTYRRYTIILPSGYQENKAYPLVINLHARCSNMQEHITYTNMNAAADAAGYIVAYPQGLEDPNDPFDCLDWNDNGRHQWDDVAFISTLIDSLIARYRVAPNQVFACGLSRGGAMSYTLACTLGARLSGIAVISGGFAIRPLINSPRYTCEGAPPIPMLIMHGDQDPDINYNGYPEYWAPVDSILAFFRDRNNCTKGMTTELLPDNDAGDNSTVVRIVYDSCALTFYRIEGGRHAWPGSQGRILIEIPPKNMDIDASLEILKFFGRVNTPTGVSDPPLSKLHAVYPNPFWDKLSVTSLTPSEHLELYNSFGETMWCGNDIAKQDFSHLPSGVYFLRIFENHATRTVSLVK